jgi:hypothetical protein
VLDQLGDVARVREQELEDLVALVVDEVRHDLHEVAWSDHLTGRRVVQGRLVEEAEQPRQIRAEIRLPITARLCLFERGVDGLDGLTRRLGTLEEEVVDQLHVEREQLGGGQREPRKSRVLEGLAFLGELGGVEDDHVKNLDEALVGEPGDSRLHRGGLAVDRDLAQQLLVRIELEDVFRGERAALFLGEERVEGRPLVAA